MKTIMRVAWKIAKKAAIKFGGRPIEYMSEALKSAWKMCGSEIKRVTKKVRLTLSVEKGYFRKSWVARITGKDSMYKFARKFIDAASKNNVEAQFDLDNGIYEVCEAGERYFIQIKGGIITKVSTDKVMEAVA